MWHLRVEGWLEARAVDMKLLFRRFRPVFKNALGIAVVLSLVLVFDPLSVASNASRASVALFYWLVAPRYPAPFDDPSSSSVFDDKTGIAVIIINDESLASIAREPTTGAVAYVPNDRESDKLAGNGERVTWPPPFAIHELVINKIFESAVPRALFIDFGFFDDRDKTATAKFAQTLKKYAVPRKEFDEFQACVTALPELSMTDAAACTRWAGRAPIFLPHAGASAPKHLQVLPALREAVTALVSSDYIGENSDSYNLYDFYDCATYSPSAASAMYLASGVLPGFSAADCDVGRKAPRVSVFWSDWGDAERGRGSFACRALRKTWLDRVGQIARFAIYDRPKELVISALSAIGVMPVDVDPVRVQYQICPPHLTVSAHEFLADDTGLMGAVLHNRYVFYGGNFVMADDLIRPPTHNAIPGVYAHAMVLDNLLQGQTKNVESRWSNVLALVLTLSAIVVAAMCSAVTWAGIERVASKDDGHAARSGARWSALQHRSGAVSQNRLWRQGGDEILERRTSVWLEVKELVVRMTPARLPLLASPYDRLCLWVSASWVSAWGKSVRRGIHVLGLTLFGVVVCLVTVSALAAIGFFWLDLAPINIVGIFSFVGFHGLLRGLSSLLEVLI